MSEKVTLPMIHEAQGAMRGTIRVTPIATTTRVFGPKLHIKYENLQRTGSFKMRGAYNKIRSLSKEEAEHGVIACSAGNHAQGVARSATELGIRSVICMPEGAPVQKIEATRNFGAEVVLVPGVYDDAAREAARLAEEKGYTFAHPFNDPYVIAGQGTIGLEILDQLPEVEQIIVPVGGGGLISGIALAVKSLKPGVKIIGVQAQNVPSMALSFREKTIRTVPDAPTIADGIHVLTPGDLTFEMCREYVDEVVTVTEDEICAAIVALIEGPKAVAEGAGATSVAAFLFDKVDTSLVTAAVVSGGNVDITTLSRIITKGLIRTGRIATIAAKIPDRSGELSRMLTVIAGSGANILSINHEREDAKSEVNMCLVSITMETRDSAHIDRIRQDILSRGYAIVEE